MKNNNDNFFIFLACSIALHLLVIYFFLVGLPSFFNKLPEEQIITFEMLQVSTVANVPNQTKKDEKPIENEEAKKVQQTKTEPIEEQKITDKAEKPKEKEAPVQKEAINIKKKEEPEIKKEPEKKIEDTKPKVLEKDDKKPKDKKKKPVNTDLDSLLKNLEAASEGTNAKLNKRKSAQGNTDKESKGPFNEDLPLSITEIALIKGQIEKHWNIPVGAENIDQAKIILYIAFHEDGSVKQVQIKDKACPSLSPSICQALADSAVRAVWQASPIENLSKERYSSWKEFNLGFDPSKMSR
jgi:flagellar biosynthesis GTPase FlhF